MELDYCPLISSLIFVRYYSERLHSRYEKKTNRKMTEEKKITKIEKIIPYVYYGKFIFS